MKRLGLAFALGMGLLMATGAATRAAESVELTDAQQQYRVYTAPIWYAPNN